MECALRRRSVSALRRGQSQARCGRRSPALQSRPARSTGKPRRVPYFPGSGRSPNTPPTGERQSQLHIVSLPENLHRASGDAADRACPTNDPANAPMCLTGPLRNRGRCEYRTRETPGAGPHYCRSRARRNCAFRATPRRNLGMPSCRVSDEVAQIT